MRKTNKKGFTIVELVVVIAVIAILAAVLIPTFSGIIKKANLSADQQAVRQMNEAIAVVSVDKEFATIDDLAVALITESINISDYRPVTKDHAFYWIKNQNKIVLSDKDHKVVYPTELASLEFNEENWKDLKSSVLYSAMGENATIGSDGKVDLASGNISYFISTTSELNLDETVITYNLTEKQKEMYGGSTIDSTAFCANGANANLTLNEGVIETNSNGVAVRQGATATINGTTIKASTHCVYAQEGTVYVTSGFFESEYSESLGKYMTLNCADKAYKNGTANIIVTGGTFVNFDPSNNAAEGVGTNFVADGYKVVSETQANGDIWYTVVAE